jgi:hypothetical protein
MKTLKNIIFVVLVTILYSFILFIGGYLYHKHHTPPITITKTETQWKQSIVYRDYPALSQGDIINKLKCYDQGEFKLDISPLSDIGTYRISGKLCDRDAYKDIGIECGESENFKLYLGIGAIAIGAGAYGIYKITR